MQIKNSWNIYVKYRFRPPLHYLRWKWIISICLMQTLRYWFPIAQRKTSENHHLQNSWIWAKHFSRLLRLIFMILDIKRIGWKWSHEGNINHDRNIALWSSDYSMVVVRYFIRYCANEHENIFVLSMWSWWQKLV